MSKLGTKLVDVLAGLAASLKLPTLLPATALVLGLIWIACPSSLTNGGSLPLLIAICIVAVSYLLHALNMPIIRALEGYILAEWPVMTILREIQLYKFFRHYRRIREARGATKRIQKLENMWKFAHELTPGRERKLKKWRNEWQDRIWHEKERLEERYPPSPYQVKPTSLGNTILAFELYPHHRYHIDIAQLWTRFVPTLSESKFDRFIEGEKAILDFLVNLLAVSSVIWVIAVWIFAQTGREVARLFLLVLPPFGCLVYKAACVAAVNWGSTVKAAFDLYRFDLAEALHLDSRTLDSLSDERSMWQGISEFLAYGREENFAGFDYTSLRSEAEQNPEEEPE